MQLLKISAWILGTIWTLELAFFAWYATKEISSGEAKRLLEEDEGGFLFGHVE